jgi:hypothetical protein
MNEQPQIIKRSSIPPIYSIEEAGTVQALGDFRDFRWCDQLRQFMPSMSEFSLSWAHLAHGQVLKAHTHPIQSMMVIHAGAGEVFGDLCHPLQAGDVLVVPSGCAHGFVGGPPGMSAVTVQFGRGFYTQGKPRIAFAESEASLNAILQLNERRLAQFMGGPIFQLLDDGTLNDARRSRALADGLRVWRAASRRLLLSQAVCCSDPKYAPAFLRQLPNGPAFSSAGETASTRPAIRDPQLEALAGWFVYQMFLLDSAEKAALTHLVLESANSALWNGTASVLIDEPVTDGVDPRSTTVSNGRTGIVALLKKESPRNYARLKRVVGEGWDMFEAMTNRIAELTRGEP